VYKNRQNDVYWPSPPHRTVIYLDGRPTFIDTSLTLIFKIGQGVLPFLFGLSRQPILRLWLHTTCCASDDPGYTTNNHWRSVDAPLTLTLTMGQRGYCNLFGQWMRPKIPWWPTATCRLCDYPGRMTKNHWCSVDAHFHHGAGRVLQSVSPIMVAESSCMTDSNLLVVSLPRTHDQKSLMLRWCSFSRWGREGIAIWFAYKGGENFLYDWLQPIGCVITQDTKTKIVHAL